MNWDAISAVAETIGVIAVFASVLYLAKQVKTGNDLNRTDTFRSIMQAMGNYNNDMFSLENAELIEKGFLSFPTLSPYEKVRFDNLMANYLNYAEDSFSSANVELLREETMQNWTYWLQSRYFTYEGVRDWWQFGKDAYPPDFQSWIESIIESTDTTMDVYGFSDPVQPGLDQVYEVRSWPNLAEFSGLPACPFPSGFLPRALHNEISEMCPQETLRKSEDFNYSTWSDEQERAY